jgi:hypothetical protein
MGSSKYEFCPEGIDLDHKDRCSFYKELFGEWDLIAGTAREVYGKLKEPASFMSAHEKYKARSYGFRFTREGFLDVAAGYCYKRM